MKYFIKFTRLTQNGFRIIQFLISSFLLQGQFGGYGTDDLWVNATGFPASTNTQTQSNLSPAITQNNNAYYVQVITFFDTDNYT